MVAGFQTGKCLFLCVHLDRNWRPVTAFHPLVVAPRIPPVMGQQRAVNRPPSRPFYTPVGPPLTVAPVALLRTNAGALAWNIPPASERSLSVGRANWTAEDGELYRDTPPCYRIFCATRRFPAEIIHRRGIFRRVCGGYCDQRRGVLLYARGSVAANQASKCWRKAAPVRPRGNLPRSALLI